MIYAESFHAKEDLRWNEVCDVTNVIAFKIIKISPQIIRFIGDFSLYCGMREGMESQFNFKIMQTKYILNKGLSSEVTTTSKTRVDHLLSMRPEVYIDGKWVVNSSKPNPYHLSETLPTLSQQDFIDKNFPANGKCAKFRQMDSGLFKFKDDVRIRNYSYTSTCIMICESNIDDVLDFIYSNNTAIVGYKTKAGAKKFILKNLK
jgi:hypothetical protein